MTRKQNLRRPSEKTFDFEKNLHELESLVERLEHGELSLEESLKDFERGIALTRECQKALSVAEQKVEILTEKNDKHVIEPHKPGKEKD